MVAVSTDDRVPDIRGRCGLLEARPRRRKSEETKNRRH